MDNKEYREQEFWEKIIKYLKGEMSAKGRYDFEETIKTDKKLAKEVERNRMIYEAIHNADILDSKEKVQDTMALIKEISASVPVDFDQVGKDQSKNFSGKIWPTILGIAATVLLLIAAIFVFRHYQGSSSLPLLAEAYLQDPYESPTFYRGPDEPAASWKIDYEKGNYRQAIIELENRIVSGDTDPETLFYLGLCYLYQENPNAENAAKQFSRVLNSNSRYSEQSLWYLALAYLLADQHNPATETLEKITGFKKNDAQELLEKLKE